MPSTKIGPPDLEEQPGLIAALAAGALDQWMADTGREGLHLLMSEALLPEAFGGRPLVVRSRIIARPTFVHR